MIAFFAKIFGGAIFSRIGAAAKAVPWQIWAVGAVLLVLGVGSCVHSHKVKAFGDVRFKAGRAAADEDWKKAFDKAHVDALAWKAKAEAQSAQISQDIRGRDDETHRNNAALAADSLRNGSGAARCRSIDHSSIPAAADRHEPATPDTNVARPAMPAEDRAAVPWGWLTSRSQEHDDLLSEAKSCREFYTRNAARVDVPH